ncbi:pilus assembly protein CpaE [Agreia sp. COWG]|uniref:pilus assembly protein CpaE n=1 Tax=Agreia sp. COWG TaxID=2773266 RepID=UPI001926E34D|nr:pilus assembly protein CpaE [Agreia sp. COWG]
MITVELARSLRDAGLVWKPASGDRFSIDTPAFKADPAEIEVFTVSDMTIEAQHYPSGTILGFNGTTEWALDSVELHEALWWPREDQLRDMLRGSFVSLARTETAGGAEPQFTVQIVFRGEASSHSAPDAAVAYAHALLTLVAASSDAA